MFKRGSNGYVEENNTMTYSMSENTMQRNFDGEAISISRIIDGGTLETAEQVRSFELLRLAFFVLKLRKLDQRQESGAEDNEYEHRRNLLRHAIFQQVVTLTDLGAKEQAMQLIEACRR
jgi:hypothetical protein